MNSPSNCLRNPRLSTAPSDPRAGKHEPQPIADTMAPSALNFSDRAEKLNAGYA